VTTNSTQVGKGSIATPELPQNLNTYTYALNNPTTFSDPTGLIPIVPNACIDDCKRENLAAGNFVADTVVGMYAGAGATSTWAGKINSARNVRVQGFQSHGLFNRLANLFARSDFIVKQAGKAMVKLRTEPAAGAASKTGRTRLLGRLGMATAVIGGVISAVEDVQEGEDVATAAVKAGIETGFAVGGAALFGSAGVVCGPAAALCGVAFGTAGAWVGGEVGGAVNGLLEDVGFFRWTDSWFDGD
jgi:hypothetical protein